MKTRVNLRFRHENSPSWEQSPVSPRLTTRSLGSGHPTRVRQTSTLMWTMVSSVKKQPFSGVCLTNGIVFRHCVYSERAWWTRQKAFLFLLIFIHVRVSASATYCCWCYCCTPRHIHHGPSTSLPSAQKGKQNSFVSLFVFWNQRSYSWSKDCGAIRSLRKRWMNICTEMPFPFVRIVCGFVVFLTSSQRPTNCFSSRERRCMGSKTASRQSVNLSC